MQGAIRLCRISKKVEHKKCPPNVEDPLNSTTDLYFERHKIINSSVMYKIFLEIFLIIYFSIIFNVAKLIKIDVKTKKTNKNINI